MTTVPKDDREFVLYTPGGSRSGSAVAENLPEGLPHPGFLWDF